MKIITSLIFIGLITFCDINLCAQFDKDTSGNPIVTKEYSEVLLNQSFHFVEEGILSLKDYGDKIIILDFWQTWCKPCLNGFSGLEKAKKEWPDKIEIIAISPDLFDNNDQMIPIVDKRPKVLHFIEKNDYPFQFVFAKELSKDLPIKVIPYKIIIAPGGKIIESKTGFGEAEKEYAYLKSLISEHFE